jgi:Tol biopolymer transport system component
MIDRCVADGPFGIVLFSLATGQKRCLTGRGAAKDSDVAYGFALSPDGATILYATLHPSQAIYTVPLAGGTPRPVISDATLGCSSFTEYGCSSMMWTPDGASIVFVSYQTGFPTVWRVPPSGGTATHETVYPAIGSFSKDGGSFAYSDNAGEPPLSIWRASLSAPGGALISSRKVVGSQYPDMDAQPSPDGTRIVWGSVRTAFAELWTSDASGAGPMQLTHLEGSAGTPRWSPDGRWIAFDFYLKHSPQIYVIDSEGRNLRAITSGDADNVVPSWSRDGNSIYFASHRTGSWQVWRHSLATGAESQVTEHGGFDPFESLDGQTVYFSRFDQAGIWSVPVSGGPESLVVADRPQVGYWGNWAVIRDGIYFLDTDAEPGPSIEFHRFATRRTTPVFTMKQQPVRLEPSLSATGDGKSVYYTQYERQSVIKLMEFSH